MKEVRYSTKAKKDLKRYRNDLAKIDHFAGDPNGLTLRRWSGQTPDENKETWKFIIQTLAAILTAIATSLGVTSCMSWL